MPATLKKILVAIADPQARSQPHLRKAAQLARRTGARVVLFHALFDPSAFQFGRGEKTFSQAVARSVRRRQTQLQKLAKRFKVAGVRSTVRVEWDYPPPEAVVREVFRSKPDLVVAQGGGHSLAARLLLLNTDWQLVEKCPAPLLMVKTAGSYSRAQILAAIDPFHVHDKPARLDRRILEAGALLARSLGGRLDVMHAFLPLAVQMTGAAVDPLGVSVPTAVEDDHERRILRRFERVMDSAGIPADRRHLVRNYPTEGIVRTAVKLRAAVVVTGAVSRRGLRSIFIGSTAARALDRLGCDLLVVKPAGFRSPVPRRVPAPQISIPWVN